MLKAVNISKVFDGKTVFSDISLNIEDGERVALLGLSGTGKTTLLRVLTGLEKPDSGSVIMKNHVRMTWIFQEDRLFPGRSVLANMKAVTDDIATIDKYLSLCSLADEKKKKVAQLSGGMSRRLAIARALAFGGELYCFDEPLQELDVKTASDMLELLKNEIAGKTALIITHSATEALTLADRIIVLSGSPAKIAADIPAREATQETLLSYLDNE